MRKFLFTFMAGAALLAIGPASALARHHGRSHRAAKHHARIRFERFGSSDMSQPGALSGASTQQSSTSDENAGIVSGFKDGVLTITLKSDGSMVTGTVTSATEVKCDMPENSSTTMHSEGDGGSRSGDNGQSGDNNQNGDENQNGDNNQNGDDQGEEQGQQNCMSALEMSGTTVREAELRLSSTGATWDKIELVSPQTAANNDNDNDANENEANDNDANDS